MQVDQILFRWLNSTALLRADVQALVGFALAIAVTVHALLRKRRVSVAVGWIGLAWLSPIFGSALYLLLGINRVYRRARRMRARPSEALPPPDADDEVVPEALWPLDRAIRRITGTRGSQSGPRRASPRRLSPARRPIASRSSPATAASPPKRWRLRPG